MMCAWAIYNENLETYTGNIRYTDGFQYAEFETHTEGMKTYSGRNEAMRSLELLQIFCRNCHKELGYRIYVEKAPEYLGIYRQRNTYYHDYDTDFWDHDRPDGHLGADYEMLRKGTKLKAYRFGKGMLSDNADYDVEMCTSAGPQMLICMDSLESDYERIREGDDADD